MLTLYDDVFSPYARKVRIALYEKGVAFERVRALHGDCNRTDFLHVNPRAEVPALIDGDIRLYDSTVICEYLEDRYPAPPIYPREPAARAQCRLLEGLADTQLDAALFAVAIVEMGRGEAHPAIHEPTGETSFACTTSWSAGRASLSSAATSPSRTWRSRRTSWPRCFSASRSTRHGTRRSRRGWTACRRDPRSPATTRT